MHTQTHTLTAQCKLTLLLSERARIHRHTSNSLHVHHFSARMPFYGAKNERKRKKKKIRIWYIFNKLVFLSHRRRTRKIWLRGNASDTWNRFFFSFLQRIFIELTDSMNSDKTKMVVDWWIRSVPNEMYSIWYLLSVYSVYIERLPYNYVTARECHCVWSFLFVCAKQILQSPAHAPSLRWTSFHVIHLSVCARRSHHCIQTKLVNDGWLSLSLVAE